jgi:hypothetical protein
MIGACNNWAIKEKPIYGVTIQDIEAAWGEFENTPLCTSLGDYLYEILICLGLPCCYKKHLWIPNHYEVTVMFKEPQAITCDALLKSAWGQEIDKDTNKEFFYLAPFQLKALREDFNKHTPAAKWDLDCMDKNLLVVLHRNKDF